MVKEGFVDVDGDRLLVTERGDAADAVAGRLPDFFGVGHLDGFGVQHLGQSVLVDAVRAAGNDHHGLFVGDEHQAAGDLCHVTPDDSGGVLGGFGPFRKLVDVDFDPVFVGDSALKLHSTLVHTPHHTFGDKIPPGATDTSPFERARRTRSVTGPIPTGCDPIDDLLGGGLPRGGATQIYGPPAAGKTNLALSAASGVAASGDSVLYIDTEGLSVDRIEQVASSHGDLNDIASRIIISEAHTFEEQQEAVKDVTDLASQIELIVLDSATGFYRLERTQQEDGEALRAVARQITHLLSLARQEDLAIAFTNQVYADPESDQVKALGGHTLNHWSAIILRLDRFRGGNRRATLEKHQASPAGDTAQFRITDTGLDGVEEF